MFYYIVGISAFVTFDPLMGQKQEPFQAPTKSYTFTTVPKILLLSLTKWIFV